MAVVRRAESGDAERVALVAAASFLDTFAGLIDGGGVVQHCLRAHSVAAYQGWLADPHAALWLAEAEPAAAPVGYALLARPDLPVPVEAGDLELKRIYLLSRFHGGGAGAALLAAAVDEARRRAAGRMLLGVFAGNERAIGFYRRHGFEQIGERQFEVGGHWYEDLVMARALEGGE